MEFLPVKSEDATPRELFVDVTTYFCICPVSRVHPKSYYS